jgi:23S rRNA pseudouridine955/2504/2580 synthase
MTQVSESKQVSEYAAVKIVVDEASEGQRIDNFLTKILKGVPKSHIYRILRSGEVRVNKGRVDASRKLLINDVVRVPPMRVSSKPLSNEVVASATSKFAEAIVYEDDAMLVINKPAGFAVHGGSGVSRGVIEQLRLERPKAKFLELVHRLDRETSGVLLLAKRRSALVALHHAIRENKTDKRYAVLVIGEWQEPKRRVVLELQKYMLPSGERRVNVVTDKTKDKFNEAQISETIFYLKQSFEGFSLLEAKLITGRTHQLRVQLAHLGFPIAGDDKYGDFEVNKALQKQGLKRMFLHSIETKLNHPLTDERLHFIAPLPKPLDQFMQSLNKKQLI